MFLAFGLLTATAVLAVLWPVFRRQRPMDRERFELAVYRDQLAEINSRYKGSGLLTISEEATDRSGAVINMYLAGNKMTFDVDLAAADRLSVRVSSKLAALARRVHGASTPARSFGD